MEKAHPDVFNLLLQILDDGRCTDSQGRTVDFKNTVIVMTSNVGSEAISMLNDAESVEAAVKAAMMQSFRPELLNRVDEKIIFKPLGSEELKAIARLQLLRVQDRLASRPGWIIAKRGYDPTFGARPIKRSIVANVETPLAQKGLAGEFQDGDTSPLLSHLALNQKEKPESLLRTLKATQEPKVISWVATGLELRADQVPARSAVALFNRFADLGGPWTEDKEEAAAGILGALSELLRLHEEEPKTYCCAMRWRPASCAGCDSSWSSWHGPFICQLRWAQQPRAARCWSSCVAELTSLVHRQHVLPAVSSLLLAATKAGPSSSWLHFATFLVSLMEALMAEKDLIRFTWQDTDRFKLADPELFIPVWASRKVEPLTDSLLSTLRSSAQGQNPLLQCLSLQALTHLLRHHSPQALVVERSDAPKMSLDLISRCACDEEPTQRIQE
eukprot:g6957.t1